MARSGPPKGGARRIGLLGGTFDPIHLAHLRSAQEVREAFRLSEVVFILAAMPPHKVDRPIIATADRWEMVKLAIAGNPAFALSDVEIRRDGRSYSIETISHYRRTLAPDEELFFILGADAFCEIETWKNYSELFTLCDFIVISRPAFDPLHAPVLTALNFTQEAPDRFRHASGHTVFIFAVTPCGVSSTEIRHLAGAGKAITYLVPPAVEAYIMKKGLYQV
jgi:nicotinate-nucleotide adenylyltransferase